MRWRQSIKYQKNTQESYYLKLYSVEVQNLSYCRIFMGRITLCCLQSADDEISACRLCVFIFFTVSEEDDQDLQHMSRKKVPEWDKKKVLTRLIFFQLRIVIAHILAFLTLWSA